MAAFNFGAWFCAKVAACRGKCLVWSSFFKKQSICFGELKLSSWICLHHGWRHFLECFVLCFFGWGGFVVELRMKSLLQAAQPGKSRRQKLLWEVAPNMRWQLLVSLWHERMARKLVNASCICNISQTASLCSKRSWQWLHLPCQAIRESSLCGGYGKHQVKLFLRLV